MEAHFMSITIDDEIAELHVDKPWKAFPPAEYNEEDEFDYTYHGIGFNASVIKKIPNSLSVKDFFTAITAMHDHNIPINNDSVKQGLKIYEKDKNIFNTSFLDWYMRLGSLNCYKRLTSDGFIKTVNDNEESLTDEFKEKYRGRAPRVVDSMAVVCTAYDIPTEDMVNTFNVDRMRLAKEILPPGEAVVLLLGTSQEPSTAIFTNKKAAQYAEKCYVRYFDEKHKTLDTAQKYKNAGDWISAHATTDPKILKSIYKHAAELDLTEDTEQIPVEAVKTQINKLAADSEVSKIEKAYKETGFKFKDCKFNLKFSETTYDNYRMEILRPGDTRMVYLGDYTCCCQRLGDAGESAMMHGLLNPKAGFWAMTDTHTGKVVAQAEVWEKKGDPDTLVFDNIEYANDCDISFYQAPMAKWLSESPYKNIYMGTGYNTLAGDGNFKVAKDICPSVTPYEIYVISHEEESEAPIFDSETDAKQALDEGKIDYFDYVYSDSCPYGESIRNRDDVESGQTVTLKEDGVIAEYFTKDREERDDSYNDDYHIDAEYEGHYDENGDPYDENSDEEYRGSEAEEMDKADAEFENSLGDEER